MLLISLLLSNVVYSQECERYSPNLPGVCCLFVGQGKGDRPNVPDDNIPDECIVDSTRIFDVNGICNENFDCCLCEDIIINKCRSHTCGGDSSCIGTSMKFNGDDLGCSVICNGDLSCQNTTMVGSNMAGLGCDGDGSCAYSNIDLTCKEPGCLLKPNGDGSLLHSIIKIINAQGLVANGDSACESAKLTLTCVTNGLDKGCLISIGGDSALQHGELSVTGATDVRCGGDDACKDTNMKVVCVPAGCILNCGGDNACQDSEWEAENVKLIELVGDNTFTNSKVTASCTLPFGCPIRCSAEKPCFNADFFVTNSNGLLCSGLNAACQDSTFELTNNINGFISCSGTSACQGITLNGGVDPTPNGPVTQPVENIIGITITGVRAAFNANIFVECDDDLGCPVTCTGNGACLNNLPSKRIVVYNAKSFSCGGTAVNILTQLIEPACSGNIEIIPINNMFSLLCTSAEACRLGQFKIFLDDVLCIQQINGGGEKALQNANIDIGVPEADKNILIKDISCGNAFTCNLLTLTYNSPQTNVDFQKITCGGNQSCKNAKFIITAQAVRFSISCNGPDACDDLKIIIEAPGDVVITVTNCDVINGRCDGAVVIINGVSKPLLDF